MGKFANINKMLSLNPYMTEGKIVKGFGRGSKELGIPTANLPEEVVNKLPKDFETGVYFGWSRADNGNIYKMVSSIGYNPYYENKQKTIETHILHGFERELYGSWLRIAITGFIRPEENYDSLEELIRAIHSDIAEAKVCLEKANHLALRNLGFLTRNV